MKIDFILGEVGTSLFFHFMNIIVTRPNPHFDVASEEGKDKFIYELL